MGAEQTPLTSLAAIPYVTPPHDQVDAGATVTLGQDIILSSADLGAVGEVYRATFERNGSVVRTLEGTLDGSTGVALSSQSLGAGRYTVNIETASSQSYALTVDLIAPKSKTPVDLPVDMAASQPFRADMPDAENIAPLQITEQWGEVGRAGADQEFYLGDHTGEVVRTEKNITTAPIAALPTAEYFTEVETKSIPDTNAQLFTENAIEVALSTPTTDKQLLPEVALSTPTDKQLLPEIALDAQPREARRSAEVTSLDAELLAQETREDTQSLTDNIRLSVPSRQNDALQEPVPLTSEKEGLGKQQTLDVNKPGLTGIFTGSSTGNSIGYELTGNASVVVAPEGEVALDHSTPLVSTQTAFNETSVARQETPLLETSLVDVHPVSGQPVASTLPRTVVTDGVNYPAALQPLITLPTPDTLAAVPLITAAPVGLAGIFTNKPAVKTDPNTKTDSTAPTKRDSAQYTAISAHSAEVNDAPLIDNTTSLKEVGLRPPLGSKPGVAANNQRIEYPSSRRFISIKVANEDEREEEELKSRAYEMLLRERSRFDQQVIDQSGEQQVLLRRAERRIKEMVRKDQGATVVRQIVAQPGSTAPARSLKPQGPTEVQIVQVPASRKEVTPSNNAITQEIRDPQVEGYLQYKKMFLEMERGWLKQLEEKNKKEMEEQKKNFEKQFLDFINS